MNLEEKINLIIKQLNADKIPDDDIREKIKEDFRRKLLDDSGNNKTNYKTSQSCCGKEPLYIYRNGKLVLNRKKIAATIKKSKI